MIWKYVNDIVNKKKQGKKQMLLNIKGVIFGDAEGTTAQNCIILLAKQFIVMCKLGTNFTTPCVQN